MQLPENEYAVVQQIYRGWAMLAVVILIALLSTLILAISIKGRQFGFGYAFAAFVCMALSLLVFFSLTFPVNKLTANWTVMPVNWQQARDKWEYSHAVNGGLNFIALLLLIIGVTGRRNSNLP
jgi:hypothetical protein